MRSKSNKAMWALYLTIMSTTAFILIVLVLGFTGQTVHTMHPLTIIAIPIVSVFVVAMWLPDRLDLTNKGE